MREGRVAFGSVIREFATRGIPRILDLAGFDYAQIDMEHGAYDMETLADLAEWFTATEVSPIVRMHKSDVHLIARLLDLGIMGVQVSGVDDAEEARAIAQEAKYPPIGNRGISQMGSHTGYRGYGNRYQAEYAPWANDNIIVCTSIESLEGLKNVDAIAAVEGVDMVAYGHSDLSAQLGIHLQLEHPRFKEVVRAVTDACKKHGKIARGSPESEAQMEEYYKLGCRAFMLPGTDITTLRNALKERADRAHARFEAMGIRTRR